MCHQNFCQLHALVGTQEAEELSAHKVCISPYIILYASASSFQERKKRDQDSTHLMKCAAALPLPPRVCTLGLLLERKQRDRKQRTQPINATHPNPPQHAGARPRLRKKWDTTQPDQKQHSIEPGHTDHALVQTRHDIHLSPAHDIHLSPACEKTQTGPTQ